MKKNHWIIGMSDVRFWFLSLMIFILLVSIAACSFNSSAQIDPSIPHTTAARTPYLESTVNLSETSNSALAPTIPVFPTHVVPAVYLTETNCRSRSFGISMSDDPYPLKGLSFQGIVPGQSSQEDVIRIFGEPSAEHSSLIPMGLTNEGSWFPTWRYGSPSEKMGALYRDDVEGILDIVFQNGFVSRIDINLFYSSRGLVPVSRLLEDYGDPEIIRAGLPYPVIDGLHVQNLSQLGLAWSETTSYWAFDYPAKGVSVYLYSPLGDSSEGITHYPAGTLPIEDLEVYLIQLFEPMSLDEFRGSSHFDDTFIEISCK